MRCILILAAVILGTACKKQEPPPPPPDAHVAPAPPDAAPPPDAELSPGTLAVIDYKAFADAVCACTDVACLKATMPKGDGLKEKYSTTLLGKHEQDAIDEATERMRGCLEKLSPKEP